AFRSVYQTSLFFGCLKAIYDQREPTDGPHAGSPPAQGAGRKAPSTSPLEIHWNPPEDNARAKPWPLVFEIGQSRAHPLTDLGPGGLHPESYRRSLPMVSVQWLSIAFLVVAGAVLGLILLPVLTRPHFEFAVGATSSFVLLLAFAVGAAGLWVGLLTLLSTALLYAGTRSPLRGPMEHCLGIAASSALILSLLLAAGGVSGWVGLLALPMASLAWMVTRPSLRNWTQSPLILIATVFIPILSLAAVDHCSSEGEPFSVIEGVSNWPAILLRVSAAAFCVFAMIRADQADEESVKKLTRRYHLQKAGHLDVPRAVGAVSWRTLVRMLWRASVSTWRNPLSSLTAKAIEIDLPSPRSRPTTGSGVNSLTAKAIKVDPMRLWVRYRRLSRCDRVAARVLVYCLPFFLFCFALIGLLGFPNNPYRGPLNGWVDWLFLWEAITLTVILIWTVFDATLLCNRLINVLVDKETNWPKPVLERAATELGVNPQLLRSIDNSDCEPVKRSLEQYADLTFLSERTAVVGRRVYDAAIASLLLFLARSPIFDQYVMSWSMILIFA